MFQEVMSVTFSDRQALATERAFQIKPSAVGLIFSDTAPTGPAEILQEQQQPIHPVRESDSWCR